MRIDVLPARQLNLEGRGGSGNHHFLRRFLEGVKSALLGGTFADFSDFGVSRGVQKEPQFGKKTHFFLGRHFELFYDFPPSRFGGVGAMFCPTG